MTNQVISDYYANLQYDKFNKSEAVAKLSNLSKNMIFQRNDNFSKRLLETAIVLENNLFLFQSFCEHTDIIVTIIEYLKYYGIKFAINKFDKHEEEEEVIEIISTFFDISMENNVQLFLSKNILQNSDLEDSEEKIYDQVLDQHNEAIIFEDSDFHTVTKVLKKTFFDTIWIQEPIAAKILPFINATFRYSVHIFRSKQELLNSTVSKDKRNTISIWSEDIIAAKNMAESLNKDIIFINTFMDIYGGIILLPHKKLKKGFILLQDKFENAMIPNTSAQLHNLFYGGMWHKPMKNTYWLNEGHLWANATYDDIKKCIDAAEKGAKIWSARCIDSRIQVLVKLASMLEYNNKHKLADIISKWTKSSHFYENSIICPQSGRLEITIERKPRGIITIKAKSLDMLFWQLTLALITGNSVIVLCNLVHCNLAPYCDMFSTSGIPPGVINMLSLENMENVLLEEYYISETELLSEENKKNPYIKFTKPKIIVLPVK